MTEQETYAAKCKHPSAACFKQADGSHVCGRCNIENVTPRVLQQDESGWMKGA